MEINLILTRQLTDDEANYVRSHPEGITQRFFYPIRRLVKNEDYRAGELVFEEDDGCLAYHKLINKHDSICGAALMSHVHIERTLKMAIQHLPPEDRESFALSDYIDMFDCVISDDYLQVSAPSPTVELSDLTDAGWSPHFARLMLYVRDVGIHKIRFEASGPVIEGLPTY